MFTKLLLSEMNNHVHKFSSQISEQSCTCELLQPEANSQWVFLVRLVKQALPQPISKACKYFAKRPSLPSLVLLAGRSLHKIPRSRTQEQARNHRSLQPSLPNVFTRFGPDRVSPAHVVLIPKPSGRSCGAEVARAVQR